MTDTDTTDDGHEFLNAIAEVQRHALGVQKATSRIWTVYCHDGAGNPRPDFEVEAELTELLGRIAILATTAGGTFGIIAQRARISEEDYVPYSYAVRWEAYAPTVDLRTDRPEPRPEPAPRPVREVEASPSEEQQLAADVESLGDAPPPGPELAGAFADVPDEDLRDAMEAEIEAGATA